MKKLLYLSGTTLVLILASCAKDDNNNPQSPSSPSSDPRDPYVAYWNVSENSAVVGPSTHTVNIVKSTSNSNEVLLNNFSGLSVSARASISGNYLTIPYQQLGSIGFASGSGTLSANTSSINMTYTTIINANRDSLTAIYTK